MEGHYLPYPVSLQLLQKHKFCTVDQFHNFISKYEHEYDVYTGITNRAVLKHNFLKLRTEAPFSRTIRFPNTLYIDMDSAKIRTVTTQFFNALFLLDIEEQKNGNDILANRISRDFQNIVIDANCVFTKFADIIMTTDIHHLEENGIYCRGTLESKYKLKWYPED